MLVSDMVKVAPHIFLLVLTRIRGKISEPSPLMLMFASVIQSEPTSEKASLTKSFTIINVTVKKKDDWFTQ